MHGHERTLLARFGFADPDRRDALHDLACRYLTSEPAIRRLVERLGIESHRNSDAFEYASGVEQKCDTTCAVASFATNLERAISKGFGNYRTTIGFIDVALRLEIEERFTNVMRRRIRGYGANESSWNSVDDFNERSSREYGIEVKATPISLGDLIRQMNLYREYSTIRKWIVATTYPLTRADIECLQNEKLQHVYLGSHFQAFVAGQRVSTATLNEEV
jgi:hypothetical protein